MALHAILEANIYLPYFQNIDLFEQGLYEIRLKAAVGKDFKSKRFDPPKAQAGEILPEFEPPLGFTVIDDIRKHKPSNSLDVVNSEKQDFYIDKDHHIFPPQIVPRQNANKHPYFASRAFKVSYKKEKVILGDECIFRKEIPLDSTKSYEEQCRQIDLLICVELYFKRQGVSKAVERQSLKCVDVQHYLIRGACCPGEHVAPTLVFSWYYFSILQMCVHTAGLGILYAPTTEMSTQMKASAYGVLNGRSSPTRSHSPGSEISLVDVVTRAIPDDERRTSITGTLKRLSLASKASEPTPAVAAAASGGIVNDDAVGQNFEGDPAGLSQAQARAALIHCECIEAANAAMESLVRWTSETLERMNDRYQRQATERKKPQFIDLLKSVGIDVEEQERIAAQERAIVADQKRAFRTSGADLQEQKDDRARWDKAEEEINDEVHTARRYFKVPLTMQFHKELEKTTTAAQIARAFHQGMNRAHFLLNEWWIYLVNCFAVNPDVVDLLGNDHLQAIRYLLRSGYIISYHHHEEIVNNPSARVKEPYHLIATKIRTSDYYQNCMDMRCYQLEYDGNLDDVPVVFEQTYHGCRSGKSRMGREVGLEQILAIPPDSLEMQGDRLLEHLQVEGSFMTQRDNLTAYASFDNLDKSFGGGDHLIIFVHGFMGSSIDLRLLRNHIWLLFPDTQCLMSTCNEKDTGVSIAKLAENLREEIKAFLKEPEEPITRVSFVGHSLGNIVIRCALSDHVFARTLPKLHTYLSLAGPHLGVRYGTQPLVGMGLWFLQKFKNARSLMELDFKDASSLDQCLLFRLSKANFFGLFKNVLLVASSQDGFVPAWSSRCEIPKEAMKDARYGNLIIQMARNMLDPLLQDPTTDFIRFSVEHHEREANIGTITGRAAHTKALESEHFVQKFLVSAFKYFE
eukprot:Clim_evm9s5 gene=Clim_evmTU9s5